LRGTFSLLLLVLLPMIGLGVLAVQTVIFLHEATTKLLTAYPARRLLRSPLPNPVLHGAIAVGVGLQLVVLAVPWLRDTLAVEALELGALGVLAGAVFVTWGLTEVTGAAVRARFGPEQRVDHAPPVLPPR
jgi:Ca2+-transporting ATPase